MSENEDFKLGLTKNILYAKVHNQHVLLQRYSRYSDKDINDIELLKDNSYLSNIADKRRTK